MRIEHKEYVGWFSEKRTLNSNYFYYIISNLLFMFHISDLQANANAP